MKIVLTQPNYAWFGKRAWQSPPYTLALLNACIGGRAQLFDPNLENLSIGLVYRYFHNTKPDVVGVSSISTEYIEEGREITRMIKAASPDSVVIQGGIIPTVMPCEDLNVDFWVAGEGEYRLPQILESGDWGNDGFIQDLDSIPFPDYGNLNLLDYGNRRLKYANGLVAREYPYAVTITSRGCPYGCIFCAASTISGKKIRYRSADNVLAEVDQLYKQGIREIIFLDDHFLGDRKRAIKIMSGLCKYKMSWKCANLTIFKLDKELLKLMKESGCYQVTVSIESGNQEVLDKIIKKPVNLDRVMGILEMLHIMDFETIVNFVIGFPGETWENIRETFSFAEKTDADMINFHIATPLPKTELMDICIRNGLLKDVGQSGYTRGQITTSEFTPVELEILRAYEWDRINFSTPERRETIAGIQGITLTELEQWRIDTRRKCGMNVVR